MIQRIRKCKANLKKELIKSLIKEQEHNLTNYSANAKRTEALVGYEDEWIKSSEKLALLSQMYDEIPDENGYSTYIGTMQKHFWGSGYGFVKFLLLAPDSEKEREVLYFKLHLAVGLKFSKTPPPTNDFLIPGIIAIRVKDGTIEEIHYLEGGEN